MSGSGSTLFGIFNKDFNKEIISKEFENLNIYFYLQNKEEHNI